MVRGYVWQHVYTQSRAVLFVMFLLKQQMVFYQLITADEDVFHVTVITCNIMVIRFCFYGCVVHQVGMCVRAIHKNNRVI